MMFSVQSNLENDSRQPEVRLEDDAPVVQSEWGNLAKRNENFILYEILCKTHATIVKIGSL
jgi:hypothetical protein